MQHVWGNFNFCWNTEPVDIVFGVKSLNVNFIISILHLHHLVPLCAKTCQNWCYLCSKGKDIILNLENLIMVRKYSSYLMLVCRHAFYLRSLTESKVVFSWPLLLLFMEY